MIHKFVVVITYSDVERGSADWEVVNKRAAIPILCREAARANALEFVRQNNLSEYEYEVIEIVKV